jgi:alkylation response protein AidB-like acyl-CoA dehydrogenase
MAASNPLVRDRDVEFLLHEVHAVERLCQLPRFAEHGRETFDLFLASAAKLARERLFPLFRAMDEHPARLVDGRVVDHPAMGELYDQLVELGILSAGRPEQVGGASLPQAVTTMAYLYLMAGNGGAVGYPLLTAGAAHLIESFGSDALKSTYMQRMYDGEWTGTMSLTEPHAGSGLGDLTSSATPITEGPHASEGAHKLRGSKIFISGGDLQFRENVVHLTLARRVGDPAGTRGISLFVVPRMRPVSGSDGGELEFNDVHTSQLVHKIGWKGLPSLGLSYGESDDCVGWLLGEPGQGLTYMFQMMNEARIGVGMGAVMLGYAGYQYSLDYARNRPQGRLPDGKDPSSPQVAIVEHTDVKRMLLTQKAYVEGGYDLGLYAARVFDDTETLPTEAERKTALELLDLLTPIVKAWPSDYCLKANELAIQILGGAGYTREYPVEQYYRDNRLNPIHEGTNGIQSLDLLGRKVMMNNGAALKQLSALIKDTCARASEFDSLDALREPLEKLHAHIGKVTLALLGDMGQGKVNQALANSALYLNAFGHMVIGWRWLEQAIRAEQGLTRGNAADEGFYRGKLQAARYFLTWEVPSCHHALNVLENRDPTCLDMQDSWF